MNSFIRAKVEIEILMFNFKSHTDSALTLQEEIEISLDVMNFQIIFISTRDLVFFRSYSKFIG